MAIEAIGALRAATGLEISAPPSTADAGPTAAPAQSFTQALGQMVGDAVGVVQNGEAAAIQGLQGTMAPFKVVEAVMSAQRTLQQTLAIRDKLVSAYQEVSRMQV
jgi:flagellar hook-basal body complex protein FliE